MMTRLVVITYVLSQILIGSAISQNDPDVLDYLTRYGYMEEEEDDGSFASLRSIDPLTKAIKEFQKMAGISVTGEITDETRKWMKMPRCGLSDNVDKSYAGRKKRYVLDDSKWEHTDLTYKLTRSARASLNRSMVEKELQRAFDAISKHTPLTFTPSSNNIVDINILFGDQEHGDCFPFGPGVLAHAFMPPTGDVHFDDEHNFTYHDPDGIELFQVALHEFGHSVGLHHSEVNGSVMAPFFIGYIPSFDLHEDDIAGIQKIYGPRMTGIKPDICQDSTIDAITATKDGKTYVFKGDYYYRLNSNGDDIDPGYPREIYADWEGSTGPVDSVLTLKDGYTYIFKGFKYRRYENMRFVDGPRLIEERFPGIPNDIDAAFVWGGNEKLYFIKGNEYWRCCGDRCDYSVPSPISLWGMRNRIDAVFQWTNGRTYFFQNESYYRYNDDTETVDSGYPKPTGFYWLGC
ncbi:hypothetical protein ScPMuIL_017324 [Solemya velum]